VNSEATLPRLEKQLETLEAQVVLLAKLILQKKLARAAVNPAGMSGSAAETANPRRPSKKRKSDQ
jgi:hypothetical protein